MLACAIGTPATTLPEDMTMVQQVTPRVTRLQGMVLNQANGRIVYRFHARDLHLVMGPAARGPSVRFRVRIDGQPPGPAHGTDVDDQGNGTVTEPRLYQLIRQPGSITDRQFEIEFLVRRRSRSVRRPGQRASRLTTSATARTQRSATRTATAGCCRRSRPGCPAGSTLPRRRSVRRTIWPARFGVQRPPTASTRSAPGSETRTGPNGTPRTWWRSRPARSCRLERLETDHAP
jgi:hypothetical protein